MIRETSILSYYKTLENLGEKQLEVLKCLTTFYSATNLMVARKLDWDINRVTPRMNELVKMNLVMEDKIDTCKEGGRKAIYWKFKKR